MADVYVLSSPAPALYAYPSVVHPVAPIPPTPTSSGGGRIRWAPPRPARVRRPPRDDDETVLAVLGAL